MAKGEKEWVKKLQYTMEARELKDLLQGNLDKVSKLREQLEKTTQLDASDDISQLSSVLDIFFTHLSTCPDLSSLPSLIMCSYLQLTSKLLVNLQEAWEGLPGARAWENLVVYTAKVRVMVIGWKGLCRVPMDDLLALPKDHPRWQHLHSHTELHHPKDASSLRLCIEDMYKTAIWAHAFVSKGLDYTNLTMRRLMTGFYCFYYSLTSHQAYHQARLNFAKPAKGSLVTLARCEDSVLIKLFERSPYKLQTHKMLFIDRNTGRLSPESSDTIPVRILSTGAFPQTKSSFSTCPALSDMQPIKVVLHCHGGGFVSMSSGGHLPYLAKWAVDTPGCVVLSVDYRLAPEHPYPAGLDDVWDVYKWLLERMSEDLGVFPSKIVFAGDSAGGHLVLGCLIKAIEAGIHRPDGMVLAYPALIMDPTHYTPSLCLALDDMVLNYAFLSTCLASYVQNPSLDPASDPLLSPGLAPASLLAQFPPTRLLLGTLDPLGDDCLRFAERLLEAKVDVRLAVFEGLVHGGMNHMIKSTNEDVRSLAARACGFICELIGN